jgi:hypothetical protein
MGKFIILAGVIIIIFGLFVLLIERVGGRAGAPLPGDIVVSRGNFRFYFPIVTSIVLSIILTLFLWLLAAVRR